MSAPSEPETRFSLQTPEGETQPRLVCDTCGFINYVNPRVVVGTVCDWQDRVLLCRRAIEPRQGFWTIPAGYLEEHESTVEGALRETREEACAEPDIRGLLAVYNIPRISQVQLIYAASLRTDGVAAGEETLEVGLFTWERIPWSEIAFPSVRWVLGHAREARGKALHAPFTNPPGERGDFPRKQPGVGQSSDKS